jgi:pyridine nucleotide-disulfide oxidoreductase family protein
VKRLVLAGAGHAHAQVLLAWARQPVPGTELVLVSPQSRAPYSGMVPGWLAGTYRFDEIVIDFAALCAAAGARWVQGELQSLDARRRRLQLSDGVTLDYDLLSLNLGSTLNPPATAAATMLSMRPLARLHEAWDGLLRRWQLDTDDAPYRVTAVGGGAAGFESLLAALARLRAQRPQRRVAGCLVSRGNTLLPGVAPGAVRAAQRALAQAGVSLELGTPWSENLAARSDLVLWATGAEAHAWQADAQRRGGLAVSERGFIRVDPSLQSVSQQQVYAVGDCAEWAQPLPKAGVYAVRMGPVLDHNLRAALGQGAPIAYVPQRRYLALLATADGSAIASRGRFGAAGRWVWRWKDHIDRRFIARFAMPVRPEPAASDRSASDSSNDAD